MSAGNVSAFIYELMREELPVERVRALVARATDPDAGGHVIPELSELADRFTVRLLAPPEGAVSEPAGDDDREDDDDVLCPITEEVERDEGGVDRWSGGFTLGDGRPLPPAMAEFVERFDERLLGPAFVTAVNEAAAHGMGMDDDTARLIADRVREVRAQIAAMEDAVESVKGAED